MSYCAVNMQKMKMGDLGGIQSHNQREHESKKNREIDYTKSYMNCDFVNDEPIHYHQAVKQRIAELNLPKAVRKDAVVYCSFIISSDREFFERLAWAEHHRREYKKEQVAIGLRPPSEFDYCKQEYQDDCRKVAADRFFADATKFFQRRYGTENVINSVAHHDEPKGARHIHLGVVPVTADGRLSAKSLFTPDTLRQLQTDFAAEVGAKYDLERGREGSGVKHIDEVTFKLEQRKAELEKVTEEVREARWEVHSASQEVQELSKGIEKLKEEKSLYEQANAVLGQELVSMKAERDELSAALNEARAQISETNKLKAMIEEFLELPNVKPIWEWFKEMVRQRDLKREAQARAAAEQARQQAEKQKQKEKAEQERDR